MADELELTTDVLDFVAHMPQGDDLVLIVLKGHLLIERKLTQIIESIVAHGDLLENVRLNFASRQALARAMCWTQQGSPMWGFIEALNALRNDIAHKLGDEKTDGKLQRLLDAHDSTLDAAQKAKIASSSTADRLKHAIMHTMGFLGRYSDDASLYRLRVDELLETLAAFKARLPTAPVNPT